jgi:hypothetical protein
MGAAAVATLATSKSATLKATRFVWANFDLFIIPLLQFYDV